MSLISVIVPVYNVEKYLHACLDSILAQTFTDFELILVDDGSPDSSGKICDEYAEKDSRIRVFHQENQGQAAARNFGVNQAKTDWIHFVDSDDIIHPRMLEILYDAATKSKVKLVMADLLKIKHHKEAVFSIEDAKTETADITEDFLYRLLTTQNEEYHCVVSKLIQKSICQQIPFTNGKTREDSAVVCQWLYASGTIAYVDAKLYFYMFNPVGTMNSGFSLKQLDIIWAWEQQRTFYKSIGYTYMVRACEIRILYFSTGIFKKMAENKKVYRKHRAKLKIYVLTKYCKAFFYSEFKSNDKFFVLEQIFPKTLMCYWFAVNKIKKVKGEE